MIKPLTYFNMGGVLKGLKDIGCNEEVDKDEGDGGMTPELAFGESFYHLMTLKSGPHHRGNLIHS